MKYFHKLILLEIFLTTILLGQSVEMSKTFLHINETRNIPIFIYEVTDLESIYLTIEYDESVIQFDNINPDPVGLLGEAYVPTGVDSSIPGFIQFGFNSTSDLFSGSGMIAQIQFQAVGQLGEFSALTFIEAQIRSTNLDGENGVWQIPSIDGTIEIIFESLTITGQDDSGASHSIKLGMCDGCYDGWKYAEDEYDLLPAEYASIYFYHEDWEGQEDVNGNMCTGSEFSSDYRNQHSFRELVSWGIRISPEDVQSSDLLINLSWDLTELNSDVNFQTFIYVGDTGYNMQEIDNINVLQSDLYLNGNNEPNIWIKLGGCAESGETTTYYQDFDGDGLGSQVEGEYCQDLQPDGWVTNNDDTCYGVLDCLGICDGNASNDACGICDANPNNNDQCIDCNGIMDGNAYLDNCGICVGGNTEKDACLMDCNGVWGGTAGDDCGVCEPPAVKDNCGTCDNDSSNDCEQDCNGIWGGYAIEDECDICDVDEDNDNQCIDCNGIIYGNAYFDNCGICIGGNTEKDPCSQDCNAKWGETASIDNCGICTGGSTGQMACEQDCNGIWGGYAIEDECGICDADEDNDGQCIDCNGVIGGLAYLDNCSICVSGNTEKDACAMDCNGVWGGTAADDDCGVCEPPAVKDNCGTCDNDSNNDCEQDCNGIWGGYAIEDGCGICDVDEDNDNQCIDCNGIIDGLAFIDNCGNCIEDELDTSYKCSMDCSGVWGGNYAPTIICSNGNLVCNPTDCNLDINGYFLPDKFDINRIYPNPFNPQATIEYAISAPSTIKLEIYNIKGQKINEMKNGFILPGHYSVTWNGSLHPSGIYFIILFSNEAIIRKKIILLK